MTWIPIFMFDFSLEKFWKVYVINKNVSLPYWSDHQKRSFQQAMRRRKPVTARTGKILNHYTFANRLPRDQEIVDTLNFNPKIRERKPIIGRVADKIKSFIDTFVEGMGGSV